MYYHLMKAVMESTLVNKFIDQRKSLFHLCMILLLSVMCITPVYSGGLENVSGLKDYIKGKQLYESNANKTEQVIACDYFENAANKGIIEAQLSLGECYRTGRGRDKNIDKEIFWYKKALDSGSLHAKYLLGVTYLLKYPNDTYYHLGLEELRDARSLGNFRASFILGIVYHNGIGVDKDDSKAIELYKEAANAGFVKTQAILYEIYSKGLYGQKPNTAEADKWRTAVKQNPNIYARKRPWEIDEILDNIYKAGLVFDKTTTTQ